jgi:membrane associated rhomboid family serine protease
MTIRQNLIAAAVATGLLWLVFLLQIIMPGLTGWGIIPRSLVGLRGLIFSPLLHAGFWHIMANTGPFFVLLLLALTYNRAAAIEALIMIQGIGGLGVWLFGAPNTVHVGASGLIFGLIGFLLFVGIFRKDIRGLLVALVVLFLYGGALISGVIPRYGVSFTGHVFGFLAGVLAARLTAWAETPKA